MSSERDKGDDAPAIAFGFRGEDINYRHRDRALSVSFTWINGARLYPAGLDKWNDGTSLTNEQKVGIFHELLRFVADGREGSIVVINRDDPARALWEEICAADAAWVQAVEYTSDAEEHARERDMFLSSLRAGKGLSIDGVDIRDECHLEAVMQARRHRRGGSA